MCKNKNNNFYQNYVSYILSKKLNLLELLNIEDLSLNQFHELINSNFIYPFKLLRYSDLYILMEIH